MGSANFIQVRIFNNTQWPRQYLVDDKIGNKEVNTDADIWDDHDEEIHGRYEDCIKDSEYDEGAIWTCCSKPGDKRYCTSSRHVPERNAARAAKLLRKT
jgi:hypothetical protein